MPPKFHFYQKSLQKRAEQNQYRELCCMMPLDESFVLCDNRKMVNFSSTDYLGLSQHPQLKKTAIKYVLEWGATSTSRLTSGHLECHRMLEDRLATLLGTEAAILFNTGLHANSTVLATLANQRSILFIDRACHSSLVQGTLSCRAKVIRYSHDDLSTLEEALKKEKETPCSSKIIITESLFGSDGDCCDLQALGELAAFHHALLCVNDTHALGVMGHQGMGLAAHQKEVDVIIGTFGKACGSLGAYVACSQLLKDYLINFCPGFLSSTALPPAILGTIDALLELIPSMEMERQKLLQKSHWLRHELQEMGFSTGNSSSHIIPLIIGSETEATELSEWLTEHNILGVPMKPPAVASGTSRIRFSLNILHTTEQLHQIIEAIKSWKKDPVLV